MPVALTDDVRAILQAHFKDIPPNEHPEGWNKLYEQDFVPWDRGKPNPALSEILARKDLLGEPLTVNPGLGRKRKKALVPGCGLGYDVLVLASFGYDAYGLEYSSLALKGAKETEEKKGSEEYYKVKDEHVGEGSVNWLSGDFFKDEWCKQIGDDFDGGFDLIYDYTFLSALPPDLRPAWSKRMGELLSPTGRLVCLEFPTYKPLGSGGPPWALPPAIYEAHLPRPAKVLEYNEKGELVESSLGEPLPEGLERVAHFRPADTHPIGVDADGNITDYLGVWVHQGTVQK